MNRSAVQIQRLLSLVPYLQGQEGIPVSQVAAEFGVSDSEIRADLKLLMFTGVGEYPGEQIDFDLNALERDGVIFIRDAEFMARPLRLTGSEGIALIVALRILRESAFGEQLPIIDSLLAKLEPAVSQDVTSIQVQPEADQTAETRAIMVDALNRGLRLKIDYAADSRDEFSTREIEPRRVFAQGGFHYVDAWCLKAEDLRFFRLDRVLSAELSGPVTHPQPTQPRQLGTDLFTVSDQTSSALLDLEPQAHWLSEYYQVEDLGTVQGLRRVRLFASDESWLRRLVLRNAGTIHVVEPASLREAVAAAARQALEAYDGSHPAA